MDKKEEALKLAEEVLTQIELEQISVSSTLLRAKRIARLTNDLEALEWLTYESEGYPRANSGKIEKKAFDIGVAFGRGSFDKDGQQRMFSDSATKLENEIGASSKAMNSFTTSGVSVGGDYSAVAMSTLTNAVTAGIRNLKTISSTAQERLSIIKNKYYNYILQSYISLKFANQVENVFEGYRNKVTIQLANLAPTAHKKLLTLEENINTNDSEKLSQVLTTCRRLLEEFTNTLFNVVLPNYAGKTFKTASGKEIAIDGDKYKNRLSAIIETLQNKADKNTLSGSHIIFMVDWIDNILNIQSKGVHSDVTKEEASRCIIHTYICIGDILMLKDSE